jgi:hypothetical protein
MKTHFLIFLKIKLYYKECDKCFITSCNLKSHINSNHLKNKSFKSNFIDCEKRFLKSSDLKKHLENIRKK